MIKDEILDKLRKIKSLAEGGVLGEKSAAEAMLQKMMKKYDIKEEDLDSEEENIYYFQIRGCKCKSLFIQVAIIYCGVNRVLYIGSEVQNKKVVNFRKHTTDVRPRGANMVAICTPAKFLELQYAYEMFQKSLDKHLEGMFYAFLDANNLLAPYDPNKPKSNMDDDEIDLAYRMSLAVKKTEINKALPQNKLPE